MTDGSIRPDEVAAPPEDGVAAAPEDGPAVTQPTKLIRIAAMTRAMLEEVRQTSLDEAGRQLLTRVHHRSLDELKGVLSPDLLEEFNEIFEPLQELGPPPSESVLRLAQAQLIGWLEGLFHGIQASVFSQQVAAQAQLAEMQQRQLQRPTDTGPSPGLYL